MDFYLLNNWKFKRGTMSFCTPTFSSLDGMVTLCLRIWYWKLDPKMSMPPYLCPLMCVQTDFSPEKSFLFFFFWSVPFYRRFLKETSLGSLILISLSICLPLICVWKIVWVMCPMCLSQDSLLESALPSHHRGSGDHSWFFSLGRQYSFLLVMSCKL